MKDFLKKHGQLILAIAFIEICLLPTEFTLFYDNRAFIDLGLLLTAVLFVIFIIPIYNAIGRYLEARKSWKK
jgi:uncharacterized membrane protein (DUF373 family)